MVQSQQLMAARAVMASAMVRRFRSPPLKPRIHSFPTGCKGGREKRVRSCTHPHSSSTYCINLLCEPKNLKQHVHDTVYEHLASLSIGTFVGDLAFECGRESLSYCECREVDVLFGCVDSLSHVSLKSLSWDASIRNVA